MSVHSFLLQKLCQKAMSLADMQAISPVSLPTLRKVVQELIDAKWIRVVGQAETTGGRPAMLFGLDDSMFSIVGVHLQLPGIQIITTDLSGNVLHEHEMFNSEIPKPEKAVQEISNYVNYIHASMPDRKIIGIGIAAPGFIDHETGDILLIGRVKGWQNFPISKQLTSSLKLPISIANDVDCMAFAELRHDVLSFADQNVIYVGYDEGVKVSMFLQGQVYKGSIGNAGLVASDLLHIEAYKKEEIACILSINGVNQLFQNAISTLTNTEKQAYEKILSHSNSRCRFQFILEAAEENLAVCKSLVTFMHEVLAAAIANVIYLLQPSTVLVGGALSSMPHSSYQRLELAIRNRLPGLINGTVIQQAKLSSKNSAAIGAIHYHLQTYISSENTDLLHSTVLPNRTETALRK